MKNLKKFIKINEHKDFNIKKYYFDHLKCFAVKHSLDKIKKASILFRNYMICSRAIKREYLSIWCKFFQKLSYKLNKFIHTTNFIFMRKFFQLNYKKTIKIDDCKHRLIKTYISNILKASHLSQIKETINYRFLEWKRILKKCQNIHNFIKIILGVLFNQFKQRENHLANAHKKLSVMFRSSRRRQIYKSKINNLSLRFRLIQWRGDASDSKLSHLKLVIIKKSLSILFKKLNSLIQNKSVQKYFNFLFYYLSQASILRLMVKSITNNIAKMVFLSLYKKNDEKRRYMELFRIYLKSDHSSSTFLIRQRFRIWRHKSMVKPFLDKLKNKVLKNIFNNYFLTCKKFYLRNVLNYWSIYKQEKDECTQTITINSIITSDRLKIYGKQAININISIFGGLSTVFNIIFNKIVSNGFDILFNNTKILGRERISKLLQSIIIDKESNLAILKNSVLLKFKRNFYQREHLQSVMKIKKSFLKYYRLTKHKKFILSQQEFISNIHDDKLNLMDYSHVSFINLINEQGKLTSKRIMLNYLYYKVEKTHLHFIKNSFVKWEKSLLFKKHFDLLPDKYKSGINDMIVCNKLDDLNYMISNVYKIDKGNKQSISICFRIIMFIVYLRRYLRIRLFKQKKSDYSVKGLSKATDDLYLNKVIYIQCSWRQKKQYVIIKQYSRKLNFLKEILISLDIKTKRALIFYIINWKKTCAISILTQAMNSIKSIVGNKLKFIKMKRRLVANQLFHTIFLSFLILKEIKTYFKDFNTHFTCETGGLKLQRYIKLFSLKNIYFSAQIKKVFHIKKLALNRYNTWFLKDNQFRNNRIAYNLKLNHLVSEVQCKFRHYQKLKKKALAINNTKSLIIVMDLRLAKFDRSCFLRIWWRRNLIIKKREASKVIYNFLEGVYLILRLKNIFLKMAGKVVGMYFYNLVKQKENFRKLRNFVLNLNKIVFMRKSFKLLLKFCHLKSIVMNRITSTNLLNMKSKKSILKNWNSAAINLKNLEFYISKTPYLIETLEQYNYSSYMHSFFKKINSYIDYKVVFLNLAYTLAELENNLIAEKITTKLFILFIKKVLSKIIYLRCQRSLIILKSHESEKYIEIALRKKKRESKFKPNSTKFIFKLTK